MAHTSKLYRPVDGWFGDPAPIFVDGTFHIFYTKLRYDDKGGPGILKSLEWAHVSTEDFANFDEHPMAITRGTEEEPDLLVGAGSVVDSGDGRFVAFYCGINPAMGAQGKPDQVIMRAVSTDLDHWEKDPEFILEADPTWYEMNDWRDPYVYRDGDVWRMLMCARVAEGPFDRRGVVGQATSTDLVNWKVEAPLHNPGTTRAPECINLFELGGRRYLSYNTYSDRYCARYRIEDERGRFMSPKDDALDCNDFYAVETIEGDDKRYLVGWLSTRSQDSDTGHRQWGGDLVAHEMVQRADGTLGAAPVAGLFEDLAATPVTPQVRQGEAVANRGSVEFPDAPFSWAVVGTSSAHSAFEATVDVSASAEDFGIVLHGQENLDHGYFLRFEPRHGRVVLDRRQHRIDVPFDEHSDRSYVSAPDFEIERPLIPTDGTLRVRVVIDGSVIICYLGDVALTTRGYDLRDGEFAVYAANGGASFSDIRYGVIK